MKPTELRNLSTEELLQKELDMQKELFKLNYQRKMGRVEKPHLFAKLKKDVARIKTIAHERKRNDSIVKEKPHGTAKV